MIRNGQLFSTAIATTTALVFYKMDATHQRRMAVVAGHVVDEKPVPKKDKTGTLTLTDSRTHATYTVVRKTTRAPS